MSQVRPYIDVPISQGKMRIFHNEDQDYFDLKWHKDIIDSTVTVMSGSGWQLVQDGEEPIDVEQGSVLNVSQLQSRNLLRGDVPLILQIS